MKYDQGGEDKSAQVAGAVAGAGQAQVEGGAAPQPKPPRRRLSKWGFRLVACAVLLMVMGAGFFIVIAVSSRLSDDEKQADDSSRRQKSPRHGANSDGSAAAMARFDSDLRESDKGRPVPAGSPVQGGTATNRDPGPEGPSTIKLPAKPETLPDRSFNRGTGGRGIDAGNEGAQGSVERAGVEESGVEGGARKGSSGGDRAVVSIRSTPVYYEPASANAPAANGAEGEGGGRAEVGSGAYVLPPYDTMLPVTVLGTFFSPSPNSSTVRMALSSTVRGDGWELPKGTLILGRVGSVVANNRVEVTVIGFIDRAKNRFVRMSGEVVGGDGRFGLRGERRNARSLLRRVGEVALRTLPGVGVGVAGGYVYPNVGQVVPELEGPGSFRSSQVFVEVSSGTTGHVMVRDVPATAPGKDAGGPPSPEEMQIIRDVRVAKDGGR